MDKTAKDQKEKAFRFASFCVRRFRTELTEEQIATELGFGTSEALYKQLELDGSPVCGACGLLYPDREHREGHKDKRKKRQPGVGGGERIDLPKASGARSLFRRAIEDLDEFIAFVDIEESWLEGNLEEGRFKGKHFITRSVDRDAREIARREEFTEEQWKELCEQHGADPASDQVVLSVGEATAGGVRRTASHFLTALIATYALAGRPPTAPDSFVDPPLTPLIEALHPDPESADMDKVYAKADQLWKAAEHLAARVRGGVVERGTGIQVVSEEEHFAAWLTLSLEEEGGLSDEEMLARLKEKFPLFAEQLTTEQIHRIRRLGLKPPH